ncbi:insulinase family protein, partial [Chlamydia psittaci 08DC60]
KYDSGHPHSGDYRKGYQNLSQNLCENSL